jgi:ABC-2 type transport system permease protein
MRDTSAPVDARHTLGFLCSLRCNAKSRRPISAWRRRPEAGPPPETTTARPATCGIDPATVSFIGIYPAQAAAAVAGVLAIGNEYSTGMIKLSLTAMPRRLTCCFAKATVLTAPVLTASALAVAGAALAGRLILPGHGFTPAHGYASLTSATDLRAAAGAVLYLTLIALLSLGLAAAVRDSAVAIGLVLGVLYLFPLAAAGDPARSPAQRSARPFAGGDIR